MSVAAVTSYSDFVVDYTIEDDSGSGTGVATSFTIAGTVPIRINGGASGDLSTSPLTISANAFTSIAAGIVPLSGGGTTHFLRADGVWASPAGAGGYTTVMDEGVAVTQRADLNIVGPDIRVDDVSVDGGITGVTALSLFRFSSIIGGTVPASGGGSSNYLRADGTWANPAAGLVGVRLQGTSPGTVDTGNAYLSGTLIGATKVMAGSPTTATKAKFEAYTENSEDALFGRAAGTSGSAALSFQRSRGTLASPTATLDVDTLGSFTASGYSTSGTWNGSIAAGMVVRADGNAVSTRQPSLTDIIGGDIANFSQIRMTGAGTRIESGLGSISNAARATSSLDLVGSLGLRTQLFSGATVTFTVGATSCIHIADCSTTYKVFNLPTAVGIAGRIYGFVKSESSVYSLSVIANGTESVNGAGSVALGVAGESIVIVSDGSNWWTIQDSRQPERSSSPADSSAYASSTTETVMGNVVNDIPVLPGTVQWQYFAGKFSTTGTPTLRFRMTGSSGAYIADSTALTMPNNASSYPWMVKVRSVVRTVVAGAGTGRVVEAILHIGSSTGALTPYSMFSSFGDLVVASTGAAQLKLTWGTNSASNTATCTAAEGGSVQSTVIW